MDGLNTVDGPTVNGLKNLTLDQIDTSILNANTIFLDNLEVSNIIIDNEIILLSGSNILANSINISDIEISYLDGVDSNIQDQINTVKNKTQNITAISGTTTLSGIIELNPGANILANSVNISDIEISYLDGATSNIQGQINSIGITDLENKTQNISAVSGTTTFSGIIELNPGANILANSVNISDIEISYLDGATSNIQGQIDSIDITDLENKTQNISAVSGTTTLSGTIKFSSDNSIQETAFTNFLKTSIFTNGTNISNLQDKTTNLFRAGTINTFTGSLSCPIYEVGTRINFPDSSIQTTAYVPNTRISFNYIAADNYIWGLPSPLSFNTSYSGTYYFESSLIANNSVLTTGKFHKAGRYMILFSAKVAQLKWFNTLKSQIVIRNQPSTAIRYNTQVQGRDNGPGNETNNEDYVYYNLQCFVDVATANDTSFAIYNDYNISTSNTSGEVTYFKGEINVYEI